MSPILGSIASISANGYGLFGNLSTNAYESIATQTVGVVPQASVTFSSIPSNYKHLQIRLIARSSGAADRSSIALKFNTDTTAGNYSYHSLIGDGSGASATGAASSGTNNYIGGISSTTAATAAANIFGVSVIDLLDYVDTNKAKTIRTLAGQDQNSTSSRISLDSGRWGSTSAINSIELIPEVGSWVQYSSFALYGIKGA